MSFNKVFNNHKLNTYVLLELSHKVFDECVVEVFSPQECVSIGWLHLKDSFLDLKDGDIEGATTKIVDNNTREERRGLKALFDNVLTLKNLSCMSLYPISVFGKV